MLEAWLALTRVKYHDNLEVLIPLNQWLALTMLRATQPWQCLQIPLTWISRVKALSNYSLIIFVLASAIVALIFSVRKPKAEYCDEKFFFLHLKFVGRTLFQACLIMKCATIYAVHEHTILVTKVKSYVLIIPLRPSLAKLSSRDF